MSVASRSLLSVTLVLLLASCGGGGGSEQPESLPRPVVSGLTESFVVLHPGEEWEVSLEVDGADGLPHPDYELNWLTDITTADGDVVTETPADGVERFRFTPKRLGVFSLQAKVQGRVLADENADDKLTQTSVVTLVVRGGLCSRVVPDVAQVRLAVGESRPVTIEGLADLPSSQVNGEIKYTPTHETIEVSVQDSAIASFSDGVLLGIAAGETKLMGSCGGIDFSLPVVVTQESLAPPAEGRTPLLDRDGLSLGSSATTFLAAPDNSDNRLLQDAQGYPISVVQTYPGIPNFGMGQYGRLLVAQWTGTGFGFSQLGTWWETIKRPRILTDGADRLYVAYMEAQFPGVFLADRKTSEPGATFRIRQLPTGKTPEEPSPRVFSDDQTEGLDTLGTLAVSPGTNKVFVAYTLFYPQEVATTTTTCLRKVRLVTATDSILEASDVFEETYVANGTGPDACKSGLSQGRVSRIHMLPPNFSSTLPRIALLTGESNGRRLIYLDWNGTSWNSVVAVDPKTIEPEHVERAVPIDFTVPADGETTQFPAIWVSNRNVPKREMWFWPMNMARTDKWTSFFPHISTGAVSLFSFMAGTETYLGNIAASFLMHLDRANRLVFEEPIWPFLAEDEDPAAMRPQALSAIQSQTVKAPCSGCSPVTQMAALWHHSGSVEYLLTTFPEPLGGPENEARGTAWDGSSIQPTLLASPSILSDGSRYAIVEYPADETAGTAAVSQLWRSDGPGFPFEHVESDGDIANWAIAPVEVQDNQFVVSSHDDTLFVLKSKDEGETWLEIGSAPCNGKVIAARFLSSGQLVAVCAPTQQGDTRPFQTLHLSKLVMGVQINDVGGPPSGLEGPGATLGSSVGILETATGFVVVLPVRGPGVGNAVLVRRYDNDGLLLKETTTALKASLLPSSVVETADGTLVGVTAEYDNGNYNYVVVRSSDDFATQTVRYQEWTGMAGQPLPIQYDADLNTLYIFDIQKAGPDRLRATVRRSTDNGETWEPSPTLLRPWGGMGQSLLYAVPEDGQWLLFLKDNSSLRAWSETSDFDALFSGAVYNQVSIPPMDLTYMRLVL